MKESIWTASTAPVFLIRFAVPTPTIFYWSYAGEHYTVVSSNVKLHDGTYDTAILTGERLAAKWGFILFMYNMLIWLPSLIFIPPMNLPLTIVDATLTVLVSIATHYQTGYVPHHSKACQDPVGLEQRRPPGTNESFFAAVGRLNETAASPTKMCADFVKEWQYGVAVSFFYALISLIGIFAFFGPIRQAKKDNTSILDPFKEGLAFIWDCLFCLVKWPVLIWGCILFYTPILVFRCLPLSFKAPVRSGRRYAVKTALGAEQKTEIILSELKDNFAKDRDTKEPYQGGGGTHNELARFLGVYDMLVMVAKHLHYADLTSLSAVSKSVRESVLPFNDVPRRLAIFRLYTCEPGKKTSCWSCTDQICDSCHEDFPLRQAIVFHHVDNCVPYCAPCYHMYIVRHSRARKNRLKGDPACKCASGLSDRKLFWRFLNRRAYYTEPLGHFMTSRRICRNCSHLAEEDIFLRKGRIAVTMLQKGLKSNGEKWKICANLGCSRSLGTGPRYWICKRYNCDKECPSTFHQAWSRKTDNSVIGEALV